VIAKLVVAIAVEMLVFAALLFGPAGTLDWWRAWVFLGLFFVVAVAGSFGILRASPDLIAERLKAPIQKDQPRADKILLPAFIAAYVASIVIVPLDVFHWRLLPQPGPIAASVGVVLFLGGCWIAYLALRENAFAAPVVKHQGDRGQTVVATGPYGVVRPMYAGGLLVFFGMPLWLDSSTATLFALVPTALLVIRIRIEEDLLRRELPGYDAYAQRVRYRLVPFLF
jgi:protein-S-isoprenylcysteine O-methyltransferase Ste14